VNVVNVMNVGDSRSYTGGELIAIFLTMSKYPCNGHLVRKEKRAPEDEGGKGWHRCAPWFVILQLLYRLMRDGTRELDHRLR